MAMGRHISLLMGLAGIVGAVTLQDAEASFDALQQWYNSSNGLWIPSTGWWNSANCEPRYIQIRPMAAIAPLLNMLQV